MFNKQQSILEGLHSSTISSFGKVHNSEINEEDRWITIKGTHVQVDDNGTIKNDKLRKKIESTSKKKVVKKKEDNKINKSKVKAEPYTGKRSGNKELDDKFDKVRDADAEWAEARRKEDKAYDDVCKSLGIRGRWNKRSYENQQKVRDAKDPNLIKAKKEVEKAMGKHARATRDFKKSYKEYRKGGGESIRDYYSASIQWDDYD